MAPNPHDAPHLEVAPARVMPPDALAIHLQGLGYPVGAKLLRRLHRDGRLPGVWTGKRLLIPVAKAVALFEEGAVAPDPDTQSGPIRRVGP